MAPATPPPKTPWLIPKLNLRIEDLAHPLVVHKLSYDTKLIDRSGATIFLEHIDPVADLKQVSETVLSWLYTHKTAPTKQARFCTRGFGLNF
jgi:hypothetical protein